MFWNCHLQFSSRTKQLLESLVPTLLEAEVRSDPWPKHKILILSPCFRHLFVMDMFLTLSLIQGFFLIPSDFLLFVNPNSFTRDFYSSDVVPGCHGRISTSSRNILGWCLHVLWKIQFKQVPCDFFFLSLPVTNTAWSLCHAVSSGLFLTLVWMHLKCCRWARAF